jgi:uncharacterized repeat protein (TIGR02543 family)
MNVVDNYDTLDKITRTISGFVNISTIGTYTLTYTAKDSSGNTSTPVTRQVIVESSSTNLQVYAITYVLNDGVLFSGTPTTFSPTLLPRVLPSPVRSGFVFQGWYENSNFTGNSISQIPVGTAVDKIYYAKWGSNLENAQLINRKIETGYKNSGYISSSGKVFVWGLNDSNQLGDGTLINRATPTDITSRFNLNSNDVITGVKFGLKNAAAISSSGRVYTWGYNEFGQLGDGTINNRNLPVEITSRFNLTNNDKIVELTLGQEHSSALSSSGRVFMWGKNNNGRLGDGSSINRNNPTDITSTFGLKTGERIIKISLGVFHSSALSSIGRVFMWGWSGDGQLGIGESGVYKTSPIDITNRFNLINSDKIIDISIGGYHSSALSSSGRVFMWGKNNDGRLGDGFVLNQELPIEITSNFNLPFGERIIDLNLGFGISSAISTTGKIFTWGFNGAGHLGDGTVQNKQLPIQINSFFILNPGESIIDLKMGRDHSIAISSEGRIFTWGWNEDGQLGNGSFVNINNRTPKEIKINE